MNRLFRLCSARRLIFFEPSSVHAGSALFVVPINIKLHGGWTMAKIWGGIEEERRKERGGKEKEEGRKKPG